MLFFFAFRQNVFGPAGQNNVNKLHFEYLLRIRVEAQNQQNLRPYPALWVCNRIFWSVSSDHFPVPILFNTFKIFLTKVDKNELH